MYSVVVIIIGLLLLTGPAISIVTITPNTNTAVTGMPYMLTCTASASDIVWENSTTSLTTETANQITIGGVTNSGEGTYTSILTFVDVRAIHGGVYKCLSNGEETSVVVNIQIQNPLEPPQFTPQLNAYTYYTGTEISWMCPFGYNKILSDPDITIFIDWLKNDQLIQQDNRITYFTEAVLIQGTPVYYGQLDYEYVTLSDSGLYHCIVYTTANPPINTQYITNNTITSTILNITIEVPVSTVTVTAESYRVPAHIDYNTATLTCSNVLSLTSFIDEVSFDKVYTWLMDNVDVTDQSTSPVDPDEALSTGVLETSVPSSGMIVFMCIVTLSVPGDPIITANGTTTVTVIAPTGPDVPINIYTTNITYDSVIIHWTIPLLAYTPEQYSIYYGTSQTSLTKFNLTVNGLVNYTIANAEYNITVTGLVFNTNYYYRIMATNTEGMINTDIDNFSTLNIEVPSDVPRNVTAIAISSEAVSLRWRSIEESARNAIINTYSINCNYSQQIKTIDAIPSIESNEEAWYSINITGFLPYTMYQCSVYANNSGGAGPNATDIVQTLQDIPGSPPTNVVINGFNSSSVIISWSEPIVPNGIITEYTVYIDLLNGTTKFKTIDTSNQEYIITDLSPYQLVEVGVSASTEVGEGSRSVPVEGRSQEAVSDAITNVYYHPLSAARLKVNFTSPSILITHGIVLYYNITISLYEGTMVTTRQLPGNQSVIETEFDGLMGEVPYTVTVFAVNSAGNGDIHSSILFTEEGVPPAPSTISVIRLNGTHMNVSWRPIPLTESNGFIEEYRISYSRSISTKRKRQIGTINVRSNVSYIIIGNLNPSNQYSVTVSAQTSAGSGEQSIVVMVTAPPASETVGFFTTMNIVIIGSVGVALLILIVVVVLVALICSRRQRDSIDLPKELKAMDVTESINIATGPSLAYGQLPGCTPEPDLDPFMKSHVIANNPTYNYSSTYNKPYDHTPQYRKQYEHTYESIDNIMASRGAGFQTYDVPKPELPAPRPSISSESHNGVL